MTNRPIPNQSALRGRTPVQPPEAFEPTRVGNSPIGEPKTAQAGSQPQAQQDQEQPADAEEKPRKDGFYITPSQKERAQRAQAIARLHNDESKSWTGFINYALMRYVKELERQYNDSKPF